MACWFNHGGALQVKKRVSLQLQPEPGAQLLRARQLRGRSASFGRRAISIVCVSAEIELFFFIPVLDLNSKPASWGITCSNKINVTRGSPGSNVFANP
jgi:hypothetical protein